VSGQLEQRTFELYKVSLVLWVGFWAIDLVVALLNMIRSMLKEAISRDDAQLKAYNWSIYKLISVREVPDRSKDDAREGQKNARICINMIIYFVQWGSCQMSSLVRGFRTVTIEIHVWLLKAAIRNHGLILPVV